MNSPSRNCLRNPLEQGVNNLHGLKGKIQILAIWRNSMLFSLGAVVGEVKLTDYKSCKYVKQTLLSFYQK